MKKKFTQAFTWAFCLFLVTQPLSLAASELMSSIVLVMFLIQLAWNKPRWINSTRLTRGVGIGISCVAVGWIISVLKNDAGTVQLPKDIEPMRRLFYVFFPWAIARANTQCGQSFPSQWVLRAIILGLVLSGVVGFWWSDMSGDGRYRGSLSWAFTYGAVASTLVFVMLWTTFTLHDKKTQREGFVGAALNGLSVVFSKTRAAWLGLVAATIVITFRKLQSWRIRFAALGIMVAGSIMISQVPFVKDRLFPQGGDQSKDQRLIFAKAGVLMAQKHFPWGTGYKNPARNLGKFTSQLGHPELQDAHCHNQWIETLAGCGAIAFVGWLIVFLSLFSMSATKTTADLVLYGGIVHVFVLSFFDVIFQDAEMSNASLTFIGFVILASQTQKLLPDRT